MKSKFSILIAFCISIGSLAQQKSSQIPTVSSGKIERIDNFESNYVPSRNVDVWLPEGYSPAKKYNVVYMHDGQMLFDSTQTWNKKAWKVADVFSQLMKENKIEECIVVGIWNNGVERIPEYFPNKIFNQLDEGTRNKLSGKYCNGKPANGDNYLRFVVTELKPYIDKHYSTKSDKDHTFMMGSSMGGLITLYAISEYPDIFGGAACMSSSTFSFFEPKYEIPSVIFDYLKKNLPSPSDHKLYMDYGTGESDKEYILTQDFIDLIAKGKGFADNYLSKVYDKDIHDEISWNRRLHVPIEFLMPKVQRQKPTFGKIDLYESFHSKFITQRNVEVWLPEGFNPKKKYAVLYLHDGQMLFDANTTWNHQSWFVDQVASKLMKKGKVQDFIVVGIDNGGKTRHADYFPQKPFESMTSQQQDFVSKSLQQSGIITDDLKPNSDNYLKFMVTELKPFIDKTYPVLTDRKHTFVAGSSMGGLISIYAICEYPDIFGGAACLSTHWPGIFSMENNPVPNAFVNYLKTNLPNPENHVIYFDHGDKTLDALYPPLQKKVDEVSKAKGYTDKNWMTKDYPGDDHSEKSWNSRFNIPLEFLLKKGK